MSRRGRRRAKAIWTLIFMAGGAGLGYLAVVKVIFAPGYMEQPDYSGTDIAWGMVLGALLMAAVLWALIGLVWLNKNEPGLVATGLAAKAGYDVVTGHPARGAAYGALSYGMAQRAADQEPDTQWGYDPRQPSGGGGPGWPSPTQQALGLGAGAALGMSSNAKVQREILEQLKRQNEALDPNSHKNRIRRLYGEE